MPVAVVNHTHRLNTGNGEIAAVLRTEDQGINLLLIVLQRWVYFPACGSDYVDQVLALLLLAIAIRSPLGLAARTAICSPRPLVKSCSVVRPTVLHR